MLKNVLALHYVENWKKHARQRENARLTG